MGIEYGKGNTAKMVGAGALIAGGLAVLRSRGNHIQIPAETIADVTLKAPVTIK